MPSPALHRPSSPIIVTGGAGFIGSHLVGRLLDDGKSVVVIDDFSTGSPENLRTVKKNPRLKIIRSKISKCKDLTKLAAKAEFIFHLAATVGVELVVKSALHVLESNFCETQTLFHAAAKNTTPILITSTSEVYGKSAKDEFTEDDDLLIGPPNQSRWSYACSKLTDEFFALACAREKNLPVIICRLFNTVGPRQTGRYGMVLPRFIAAAKKNQPLQVFGDGGQTRCFCLVSDAVEALVRLKDCRKARGEIFNIGGTEEISILDLAKLVVKTLGSKSRIELVPYDKAYAPGFDDMRRRKPRVEKLERFLDFKPETSLQDIIRRTAII
ncbi:MAG TPA: NAD-dependent epimerase/dehydratase family protein [Candidatus Acidoferrum sp.]|jgi:UDP-glucose 4-epimerase|nr:NAD-dependent epimerase/dehydratase family protein [Candidatus Acidoferrum sp.]